MHIVPLNKHNTADDGTVTCIASIFCMQRDVHGTSMCEWINATSAADRESHLIGFCFCVLKLVLYGSRGLLLT
jgi:hypothetical protein